MKHFCIALLVLEVSVSAFSQRMMIAHKKDGTREYVALATVDSLVFPADTLMVAVGGGSFTAGTTLVPMTGFSIDKYEVTYELWTSVKNWGLTNGYTDLVAGANGYNPVGTNNPVTSINWYDMVKWCNARSEKGGLTPVYYTDNPRTVIFRTGATAINNVNVKWIANGYRLPTEAEWEFAAKGGSLAQWTPYTYSGSNTIDDVAWYVSNSGNTTHTVGLKTANELGIYDMSGSVWELCWDWYDSAYPSSGTIDPQGPSTTQTYRLLRGGAFNAAADYTVVLRGWATPSNRDPYYGFRCVQD